MIFPLEAAAFNVEETDTAFEWLAIWRMAFCFQMHLVINKIPTPFAIDGGLHGRHACNLPALGERRKGSERSECRYVLTGRSGYRELVHDHAFVVEILRTPAAGIVQLAGWTKTMAVNKPVTDEKLELKCLVGWTPHERGDFRRNLRHGSLRI